MDLKRMIFPRNVTMGPDALDAVPEVLESVGMAAPVAVTTGQRTAALAGERVVEVLDAAGIENRLLTVSAPTAETQEEVVRSAEGCRSVLGVGGGGVIDAAKLLGRDLKAPMVSVPTAASHDGIASPRVSLRDGKHRHSVAAPAPLGIIADTEIISQAPHRLTAAGVGDAVSNLSAVADWELAHRVRGEEYSDVACTLAKLASRTVLDNVDIIRPGSEPGVRVVVKSLILGGVSMGVAGSSRPASGAEHLMSHALDVVAPDRALHGEQVGVTSILSLYLHGGPWKTVRSALESVGAPTDLGGLKVTRAEMLEAMTTAHTIRDRYTILGTSGLTKEAAERALDATGVARGG